jgi:hypothetical protein
MKISRIEMSDFRGFRKGEKPFLVDLGDEGNNLLLYGENGSGKSSIALALDRVVRARTHDFKIDANRFRRPESEQEGFVTVTLSDGKQYTYGNTTIEPEETVLRSLDDAQLRCGFLGYKVLLRTSFYSGLSQHSLFELLVSEVLADHRLIIDGSSQAIIKAWRNIENAKPQRRRAYNVPEYHRRIDEFNKALSAALAEIETTARLFLAYFTQQKVQLRLEYQGAKYDEDNSNLLDGTIIPHVEFGPDSHTDFSDWLNEARLSCLALCLHLASVKKRDIAPYGNLDPLRVLCLDDVLIGLDMSNRRHVLQILTKHFGDFQIILTTYDRHWFEIAKKELGKNWLRAEIYEGEDDVGGFKPILITPSLSDYEHAKVYLDKKDYAASANYLRKVCEAEICRVLPEWCRRNMTESGELYYVNNLQDLHSRLMDYLKRNGIDPQPYSALDGIKAAILNPFSHADMSSPLYRGELLDAFEFIKRLGSIQRTLIVDKEVELTATKTDAEGSAWGYTVQLKEPLYILSVDGATQFTRCEARPRTLLKNREIQILKETDRNLKHLYERYCHFCKVSVATPYDDFNLPDGQSITDTQKRIIEGTA